MLRVLLVSLLLGACARGPGPADAPGAPDLILFSKGGDVWRTGPGISPSPVYQHRANERVGGSAWSPDGQWVFLGVLDYTADPQTPTSVMYRVRPDGTNLERLTAEGKSEALQAVSPDGTMLAFTAVRGFEIQPFVRHVDGTGELPLAPTDESSQVLAWSPHGEWILLEVGPDQGNAGLRLVRPDGSEQVDLATEAEGSFEGADFSPDGSVVASKGGQLWRYARGVERRALTPPMVGDRGVTVSPRGDRIAFLSTHEGPPFHVYLANADGSGILQLAPEMDPSGVYFAWSPDGSTLTFDEETGIHLVSADGGNLRTMDLGPDACCIAWSPQR